MSSDLTEAEIFSTMKDRLRSAIADCRFIANFPVAGPTYKRLRQSLKLVEGCCRQAAYFRQDARWFGPGRYAEEAHQRARLWLHRPSVQTHKLFTKLADALEQWMKDLERLEKMPSGRVGTILPKPQRAPLQSGRPVSVIMPSGVALKKTAQSLPVGYITNVTSH
jgi:hypothetical protein